VASIVHLPIILAVHRALKYPKWMALVGAALSPFPMVTIYALSGRSHFFFGVRPADFIVIVAPYILAGAAMGWSLAGGSGKSQNHAELVVLRLE